MLCDKAISIEVKFGISKLKYNKYPGNDEQIFQGTSRTVE